MLSSIGGLSCLQTPYFASQLQQQNLKLFFADYKFNFHASGIEVRLSPIIFENLSNPSYQKNIVLVNTLSKKVMVLSDDHPAILARKITCITLEGSEVLGTDIKIQKISKKEAAIIQKALEETESKELLVLPGLQRLMTSEVENTDTQPPCKPPARSFKLIFHNSSPQDIQKKYYKNKKLSRQEEAARKKLQSVGRKRKHDQLVYREKVEIQNRLNKEYRQYDAQMLQIKAESSGQPPYQAKKSVIHTEE